ncbi:PhoH family protein [Pseudogemmobacter faecipullorum]|uniref:PhoH-like protein n=1 Tax=Pseudogemmobacter faecipullorum TaxID=2755041 RepID=A0ABS8CRE3_9RHOB|nr:PhoH family protein [Pseudogemmobacter faecipullorum]MCB5411938.1 PhoH family protein [Pseudogemmobacter faecipullorum]
MVETVLEFPDNRLLIGLCGEYDRNLSQIENQLGLHILRRGNRLVVVGDKELREQAAAVLRSLYARLEEGRSIGAGDIDGALRFGSATAAAKAPEGEQIEMFAPGMELRTRKKPIEPRTEAQKAYVANLFRNELGFGIGPAGTGKTYLAVAVGVTMLLTGAVEKIVLSRPAVEAGERLGFLPGDMKEKVDPYMQPLYDALNDFLPARQVEKLIAEKRIEIAPLAFMRGRTLANSFVVLDEAQNSTAMQMKMFLTRLGEGSRMVITGDRTQVDLPRGVTSGLSEAERILKGVQGISFNYFTAKDVVRHPLVGRIIEAWDADEARA